MTGHELVVWRLRFALNAGLVSQVGAARALGIACRTYQNYERGERPIPRAVDLACRYLAEHPDELSL